MTAIEIARRMAELGQPQEALKAYTLAATEGGLVPEKELEAAVFILQAGGDYEISYACFLNLYRQGHHREETLALLTGAFYEPNIKLLQKRYERNIKLLKKYPYLFKKDFLPFEELPIRFYPYNDDSYVPFFPAQQEFGEFVDIKKPVISRNFFKDLENPILADDVYSQYELEYLRDNVRKSEYVAKDNHIYLHYTDWTVFCAWLQVLDMRPLLKEEKLVFLIEDEISQYPIDFKARFGIDYSEYEIKPIGIREIQRLIWLSQLSSHNGINFFSEVLDGHPNVLSAPVYLLDNLENVIVEFREVLEQSKTAKQIEASAQFSNRVLHSLFYMKDRTDKDIMVAQFFGNPRHANTLDPTARIAPALLLSPHFKHIDYQLLINEKGQTVLYSDQYEKIRTSPVFREFKYIKTVAPMRRPTTSYGAALKFILATDHEEWEKTKKHTAMDDELAHRMLNRSYLIDWQDRLFKDSILVRFEDGKLNPKATFTALAEFLDLPYTESMTCCSRQGERDPETEKSDVQGFDTSSVYRTYDEYENDAERVFVEYCLRDVYEAYGYDLCYYNGEAFDEEKAKELLKQFSTIDGYIRKSVEAFRKTDMEAEQEDRESGASFSEEIIQGLTNEWMKRIYLNREKVFMTLLRGLHFVNRNGQPLRMMPLLKLDPALLEQPLYH